MSQSTKEHKARTKMQLAYAVFTCSTTRYEQQRRGHPAEDVSGDLIESLLRKAQHRVAIRRLISDEREKIQEVIRSALDSKETDAVIFCGGTGITPSDVTIEAVSPFLEKILPGFGEIFRRLSFDQIGSAAMLSRALCGVAKGKAVFCIPGSPDAVRLCVERLILTETGHVVKHSRE